MDISQERSSRLSILVMAVVLLSFAITVSYLCSFKVSDRDTWWHIKAGDIMLETKSFIDIEPFAYTREGEPYLARHEWLAQIMLSLTYHLHGSTGLILLRTALAFLTFFLLLLLDRRRSWINVLFAIGALGAILPAFSDRPQMFTYVLFSVFLFILFRARKRLEAGEVRTAVYRRLLAWLIPLSILWVNLHGAAALMGIVLFGLFCLQDLWDLLKTDHSSLSRALLWMIGGGFLLLLSLLLSPDGFGNFRYLFSLGETTLFIREWQAREIFPYLRDFWWLWMLALGSLFAARKDIVMAGGMLLLFGILSRLAVRHEMLFVLAALSILIVELSALDLWRRALVWVESRMMFFISGVLLSAALMAGIAYHAHGKFIGEQPLHGFGTLEVGKGAADFLEREAIRGPMFNTYGLGGYLLFRGYPDRKIYVDGRNVEYGESFLRETFAAAQDRKTWQILEDRYGFTHAIIDYADIRGEGNYPYTHHLGENPDWALAYLDDWVALYLKRLPEHAQAIADHGYLLVTPENLYSAKVLTDVSQEQLPRVEQELKHLVVHSPESIKARLTLARLYLYSDLLHLAEPLLSDAHLLRPRSVEALQLLGTLRTRQERYAEAADLYARSLKLAPDAQVDYAALADVFEKAGRMREAEEFRRKAEQ